MVSQLQTSWFKQVFLSALDVYRARLSILLKLSAACQILPLVLTWLARLRGFRPDTAWLIPLHLLHTLSFALVCIWTARVFTDIHAGNRSSFALLWRTTLQGLHFWRIPLLWFVLLALAFPSVYLLAWFDLSPWLSALLLGLHVPLLPLFTLIVLSGFRLRKQADTGDSQVKGTENTISTANRIVGGDVTRPMAAYKPTVSDTPLTVKNETNPGWGFADQPRDATMVVNPKTNPAGFPWTKDNKAALMMDILSGQLNLEDAKKRYGLKSEELKAWMKEHMRQNQAPKAEDRDIPKDSDTPA